jgi:hypothetical protein
MLLLSSWHIEFSRFARFYSAFQFLFLLFVYSLHEGYGAGKKGFRIVAFVLGLLSVSIDSYSIFLPLMLLSMIVLLDEADRKTTLSLIVQAGVLIAINLAYSLVNFDTLGVVDPLPRGFEYEKTSPYMNTSPIIFPGFGLLRSLTGSMLALAGYLLLLGGAGYLFRKSVRYCRNSWDGIALVLSLSLPLLHQYTLLVFLLIILLINKRTVWGIFQENALWLGIFWIGTGAYWGIANYTGNRDAVLHFLMGFPETCSIHPVQGNRSVARRIPSCHRDFGYGPQPVARTILGPKNPVQSCPNPIDDHACFLYFSNFHEIRLFLFPVGTPSGIRGSGKSRVVGGRKNCAIVGKTSGSSGFSDFAPRPVFVYGGLPVETDPRCLLHRIKFPDGEV